MVATLQQATGRATRKDWIQTYTGRQFRPLQPDPAQIDIRDIAHALSNQCRFTGHTSRRYSVAEHSVYVASQCLGSVTDQLWGLLHDASEAYLADVSTPVKHAPEMAPYRVIEKRLMAAVCSRFGLPREQPECVSIADGRMLSTEARDLMYPMHPDWHLEPEPYGFTVECWSSQQAEQMFLSLFDRLYRAHIQATKALVRPQ